MNMLKLSLQIFLHEDNIWLMHERTQNNIRKNEQLLLERTKTEKEREKGRESERERKM